MAGIVACPPRESDLLVHHGGGAFPAVGWSALENFTQRIICLVEPTVQSERTRRTVVDYVQRLMGSLLGAKVSALGSVPFKTYLSDGDIDLTVFSPSLENLASNIHNILQGEEKNMDTELDVKDVQYIHAEVPLVKCLIENIVVDISFNQAGGLHTLHFLEKVDNFIGKDHLFKRSVMLIKAWCYYESRILGSTHGLLSTYALEILILYIFHLFHSKLAGPLSVLYRFLDYFSKFDWDCYCISLYGPVHVSSLPNIIVGPLENDGDHLLFHVEFLEEFVSSSPDISENNHRLYAKKHLNIIDPLKSYNNLGRSVSKGNLFRIRSAFKYGAKQLHETLQTSKESMECELRKFFANTIERHECRERADIQYKSNLPDNMPSSFGDGSNLPKEINTENSMGDNMGISACTDNCHGKLYVRQNGIRRLNLVKQNGLELESQCWFSNDYPVENQRYDYSNVSAKTSQVRVDVNNLPNQRFINERRLSPTTTVADSFSFDHGEDMREDTSQSKTIPSHNYINGLASSSNVFDLDHEQKFPYYNGIPCWDNESLLQLPLQRQIAYENSGASDSAEVRRNDPMDQDYPIDHGQWSKNCNLNIIFPEWNPSTPFCRKSPRDALQRWNNIVPHRHRIIPSPPFSPNNLVHHRNGIILSPPFSPDTSYEPGFKPGFNGMEGFPKSRGTGTYFPITSLQNNRHYKDGQLKGTVRSSMQGVEYKLPDKGGCESLAENDKKNCESARQSPRPAQVNAPERLLQFGTLGPVSVPLPDPRTLEANGGNNHGSLNCSSKSPASSSSPGSMKHSAVWKKIQTSSTASEKPQTTSTSSPKASKSTGLETKELSMEYKLKDEDEFPPLNTSGINVNVQKNLEKTAWGKSTRS